MRGRPAGPWSHQAPRLDCGSLTDTHQLRLSGSGKTKERIIVCYFTNWAWYRAGIGKFTPDDIDTSLCTYINYAFASLDNKTFTIKSSDPWADIDNKFYAKVVAKKKNSLISIGGWNDSAGKKWSQMWSSAENRKKFITSVIEFLKKYNFRGIDFDVEYPACPQGNKTAGTPGDKENFNKLIKEMKLKFDGKWLISVTIPAGLKNLKDCYNIKELCEIGPDWINVMAYDFYSAADGFVGANAPICGTGKNWGVYDSLEYLTKDAKCPANKLTLGLPGYGKSYTLADESKHGFGAKVSGTGTTGAYTKEAGFLTYYEICLNQQKNGWKTGWSKTNDSYAWKNNQLVTFDDFNKDIKRKCCLITRYFDLLGAMFWALDYDDFRNSCGYGVNPVLKTINQQLICPY